ncbi:hypothetical protein CID90_21585 [Salmonella enterica]|nr:hypothetical protein [Salmonella enterica]EDX2438733.1 hypothetical protein [Salmonella enterica subsp. enterica serovar Koenigstuhl]
MTTITKEWLQQTIAEFENTRDDIPFDLSDDDARILIVLKRALASLEAEPIGAFHIADQQVDGTTDYIKDGEWPIDNGVIEVYAAPPARDNKQTDELVMWVKRLAHSLRNARPNSKLHDAAMDYLSRKGLISVEDVLR